MEGCRKSVLGVWAEKRTSLSLIQGLVTNDGRVWRKVPKGYARSVVSSQTFRRALTASVHGQLRENKECRFQWRNNQLWQSSEEGAGKRCSG